MLDAAEALIIENGGDFEISELAAAAGVSNGLAYHYFGSKDGLIGAVIDRFYARYSSVLDREVDADIAWPVRERARLRETVDFLYSDPFAPTVFGALNHPGALAKELELRSALSARAARNIRSGQRRGHISAEIDCDLAGAAIIGAVHSAMMVAMKLHPRPTSEQVTQQLWGMIRGAVGLQV